jgi:hypothetical protein
VATEPSRFGADNSPGYECHQHNRENRSPNEVEGSSIESGAHRLTIVTVQANTGPTVVEQEKVSR